MNLIDRVNENGTMMQKGLMEAAAASTAVMSGWSYCCACLVDAGSTKERRESVTFQHPRQAGKMTRRAND